MIKTTVKCDYSKPNQLRKLAYIELTASYKMSPFGVEYHVVHNAIIDDETNAQTEVTTTDRFITIEQYNMLSGAVDGIITNFDTSEMTAFELEQFRVKLGLYIYITSFDFLEDGIHVAYNLMPSQWILSNMPEPEEPEEL